MFRKYLHTTQLFIALLSLFLMASASPARALNQWATSLIGASSQYGAAGWSALQAVGAPNTFGYGDSATAWAPAALNGTLEWIAVGYDVPVFANSVVVREVWGNGFVRKVEVLDTDGLWRQVWTGTDKSLAGSAVNYTVKWTQTNYPVIGVRVSITTDKNLATREQIDAIQLIGEPAHGPVSEWATGVLNYSSQYSSTNWGAKQAVGPPDTQNYGDFTTAWSPSKQNNSLEYLTVEFPQPLYATGVTIRETYGNGFVYQIDVVAIDDTIQTVWTGTDSSAPGSPANFNVNWPTTSFYVKGVRIHVNTSHNLTAWEQIDAVQLHGITSNFADLVLAPSSTVGGKKVTGKLYLFTPAPAGGATIELTSSNPALANLPASVVIPEGQTQATFIITTAGVTTANTKVTITASMGAGDSQSSVLSLQPAAISSVSLTPADVVGGKPVTGKVTLSGFAPPGGAVVDLANTNIAALVAATTVTVPEGASTVTFPITTSPVTTVTTGNVSATYKGVTKSATLDVLPATLLKITLSPTSLKGGLLSTATVFLNGMGATSNTVTLSTSNAALAQAVDAAGNQITTVTIPAGTDRATFKVKTFVTAVQTIVNVNAQLGGPLVTAKLTIKP